MFCAFFSSVSIILMLFEFSALLLIISIATIERWLDTKAIQL